jgi:hypothetical protein
MGWAQYELAGLTKVVGALIMVAGLGLAVYELSLGDMVTAVAVFLVLLVIGIMMVSWGGYARRQNTPMGRLDDVTEK